MKNNVTLSYRELQFIHIRDELQTLSMYDEEYLLTDGSYVSLELIERYQKSLQEFNEIQKLLNEINELRYTK